MDKILENPTLARIVADITGDGHLQIQDWRYLVSFYSKEIEEIEAVKKRFRDLFNVEGRVYFDNRKTKGVETPRYKLFFISKPVATFLKDVGTPVGNKTNISFEIPEWVMNGRKEIKAAYLRGLFDCEGTIFCRTATPRWQIGFKMGKNVMILDSGINYINQIRAMLNQFGIRCSPARVFKLNVRKDGSQSYDIQFNIEKLSFKQFHQSVGFDNKSKRKKLIKALNTFS